MMLSESMISTVVNTLLVLANIKYECWHEEGNILLWLTDENGEKIKENYLMPYIQRDDHLASFHAALWHTLIGIGYHL